MGERLCEVCGTPLTQWADDGPVVHVAHGLAQCPPMAEWHTSSGRLPKTLPDPETSGQWPTHQ